MVSLDERFFWFAVGCVIGYIIRLLQGIKKNGDETAEALRRDRGEDGFMRYPLVADLLYFIVLLVVLAGAWRANEAAKDAKQAIENVADNAKQDEISRCQAGVDNRIVQRDTVDAIYDLATGFIQNDGPRRSPEEVVLTNAYIDRVNAYRDDAYAKIKPSEACKPFVEDDEVTPPTPPFPHVTR